MTTQVDSELQQKIYTSLDQIRNVLFNAQDRLQNATQQAKETLTQTTGKAIKAVDIQSAIASTVSDWLQDHPTILRLAEIFIWGIEHPIISLIVLLFVVAISWSLIKAIGRLIDRLVTSLWQAPLKLLQVGTISIFHTLHNLGRLMLNKPTEQLTLQQSSLVVKDKYQQLTEISTKLEALHQEQNELLKALMELLSDEKVLFREKDK
ncbi:hypothetical protein [Chroococcidiopsis sp. TS-821]|uniref:hypothetical protein n=1 Tax=Chroococcidiopsis sp. TS-821 TaxID=1378066 RepID=UPI000CEF45D4|nr:hypothetical protein [Chroococcidiopsis sp. TS-821]PPS40373.1 hypothetical protein B1A85_20125 [Chroococcidiopsis sp. TS-821]